MRLPPIVLKLVEDLSPPLPPGFLRLVRRRYRAVYPDGSESAPFVYDIVDRRALDAVVLAAHFMDETGIRQVYLRSAVRPPAAERDPARSPSPEDDPPHGGFWELPAGLVEPDEQSREGLVRCARRELVEELGFEVEPRAVRELGPATFPVPGLVAERQYFFEIEVSPATRREPTLDGSPLERFGEVVALPLSHALELCRSGALLDGKTELGLRRLAERHGTEARSS